MSNKWPSKSSTGRRVSVAPVLTAMLMLVSHFFVPAFAADRKRDVWDSIRWDDESWSKKPSICSTVGLVGKKLARLPKSFISIFVKRKT